MDEGHEYPLAAELVKKHFYVDDCLFSAPTFEEAREAKEQLISLLNLAQLELSKFRSNHPDLQSEPTDESQQIQEFEELVVKTLGMTLNVNTDTFQYKVAEIPEGHGTLRVVMSTVARIYDPLGLITPITVVAKAILQSVWKFWKDTEDSVNFDKPIPPEIEEKWIEFKENLQHLEKLRIPRWISSIAEVVKRVLHCFCDASKLAHASCIYLVSEDATGNRCSRLLTSKSKVNPMKFRDQAELTIPKAELCAAELAANLAEVVSSAMGISECHLWTDATVVLYQIYNSFRKRESFVKRRTEKILKLTTAHQWSHVDTKENPADLASRGTSPQQLESSPLWWNGPTWLLLSQKDWPKKFSALEEPTECSLTVTTGDTLPEDNEDVQNPIYQALLSRYSTYSKLRRVTARCLEASFIWKSTLRRANRNTRRPTFSRHLSVQYLRDSETFLIKSDQRQHLGQVIRSVENGALNSKRIPNQIQKLRPFLDADGVLRVGGRLTNSLEPFDARHPRILPKSHLAKLIAEREHVLMLHSGPQLTLSSLRQRYWPIGGRNLTKKIARNCHPCIRAKPPTLEQLMGNLPRERVVNFRPFTAVGVDFAGPFLIKHGIRKYVKVKAYVAVFVCFGTKAVHLELVSSLHTAEFIAAFRRFSGQIRELWETENHKSAVHQFASELEIEWSFLTPRAPHQGGIYEAAVKSFKHHFVRVIGRTTLTFENFTTLLCQIEAVLNSRPLITLSENPEDPVSLTPSFYLIHSSLTQLPDPDLTHLTWNHLSKWQMVQRISQEFTKRWKREYLNTLQSRQKWSKDHENLKEGDMVMISDEILPSTKWPIGIVERTYPGQDDCVRVVDVRTRQGTYRRAIQKLIKLPVDD
ncbi:uncharacterized protein LOC129808525 [Phlebotomus papatasi]|uniref:uncharacterized protein LOC129808525 n=1 Tax=Phlebotomus papatasi TaxID=29031 RepID=UPI0024839539|nr:uncharacterized protein LOC129808525 [Phlebotomus papatasi]